MQQRPMLCRYPARRRHRCDRFDCCACLRPAGLDSRPAAAAPDRRGRSRQSAHRHSAQTALHSPVPLDPSQPPRADGESLSSDNGADSLARGFSLSEIKA
jgi:hypothetical protein